MSLTCTRQLEVTQFHTQMLSTSKPAHHHHHQQKHHVMHRYRVKLTQRRMWLLTLCTGRNNVGKCRMGESAVRCVCARVCLELRLQK